MFFFLRQCDALLNRCACDGVWSAQRDEFRRSARRDEETLAPLKFRTQNTVRYHHPPSTRPHYPSLIIQNRGQHKHTNQCLISFTKGMLTLLKGHWKIAYARVSADYAISMYLYLFSFTNLCTVPSSALPLSPINEGVARIVVRRLTECRARKRVMCDASLERKKPDAGKRNDYM